MSNGAFKKGDKVIVFNQCGSDWPGIILAINKHTARVEMCRMPSGSARNVFTHQRPTRMDKAEDEYLVPFSDMTIGEL